MYREHPWGACGRGEGVHMCDLGCRKVVYRSWSWVYQPQVDQPAMLQGRKLSALMRADGWCRKGHEQ